jgi:hypothetical protein
MNKTGFFRDHREAEHTHGDIWVLSRLLVASSAAMTVLGFGMLLA